MFPGIPEALTSFRDAGHSLQVVTVRSIGSARLVVRHFGLDRFFDAVHGPDRTQRSGDKADLVRAALDLAGADPRDTIMIGDRADDIRAARAHGVRSVAVGWGYGTGEELREAGFDFFASSVADLVACSTNWMGAISACSIRARMMRAIATLSINMTLGEGGPMFSDDPERSHRRVRWQDGEHTLLG